MAVQTTPILIPRSRVSAITGLQRSAIYDRMSRGEFPKPVTIGTAAVRWVESEVVGWVQRQIDASRNPGEPGKDEKRHMKRSRRSV